eukprot:g1660.t1
MLYLQQLRLQFGVPFRSRDQIGSTLTSYTPEKRRQNWSGQKGLLYRKEIVHCCSAVEPSASQSSTTGDEEYIEVYLDKPLGLKFGRGRDSGAYVVVTDPQLGNTDERIQVGDKIVKVSATFGTEIWDAKNFGQIIYAIRTRNGKVYLKLKKMYGDLSMLEEEDMTDEERMWKREQRGGNVGMGTRQKQERNYRERKEKEKERLELCKEALKKFDKGDIEGALIDFENVISTESTKYVGEDFSRVSKVCVLALYNSACCYSMLEQVEPALEALERSLKSGFEDYNKVRTDPNLAKVRESEKFTLLINQYDEPIINENAMNVIRNIFSFGKKQE